MSEYDEQCAVVEYCDLKGYPCIHVANEGKRNPATAERLKKSGMRPGFPDLLIPMARGAYHSLFIEMKADGGKPTGEQVEWIHRLREQGMCAWVCIGAVSAIEIIDRYMALQGDGVL